MEHKALMRRPFNRISHVLSRFKKIWHFYPEHSLKALVQEATIYANEIESALPAVGIKDIEDIPYPANHFLHHTRNLEMGLDALEKQHADQPLPPVPIQTAVLGKVGAHWRKNPQMRLGQLLSDPHLTEERE